MLLDPTEVYKASANRQLVIGVVGLGRLGAVMAIHFAAKGFEVVGVDVYEAAVHRLLQGPPDFREEGIEAAWEKAFPRISASTNYDILGKADVIIFVVGTPLRGKRVDLSQVIHAAELAAAVAKTPTLLILKSTVKVGTTRRVARVFEERGFRIDHDFCCAFSPERVAEGRMLKELDTIPEIVGGVSPLSTELTAAFFRGLGKPVVKVSSAEAAELVKLVSNAWIDLNIALANQIAPLCTRLNIDLREVISAANTLRKGYSYVNILNPGLVGGYCLPKDPYILMESLHELGIEATLIAEARHVNESTVYQIYAALRTLLERYQIASPTRIALLGLAFKGEVEDVRESQSLVLYALLKDDGHEVVCYDPYVASYANIECARSLREAVEGCQAIIVATEHRMFGEVDWKALLHNNPRPLLFIDARGVTNPQDVLQAGGIVWWGWGRGTYASLQHEK